MQNLDSTSEQSSEQSEPCEKSSVEIKRSLHREDTSQMIESYDEKPRSRIFKPRPQSLTCTENVFAGHSNSIAYLGHPT